MIATVAILCSCKKQSPLLDGSLVYVDKFEQEYELSGDLLPYIEGECFFGCEIKYPYLLLNLSNYDEFVAVYDLHKQSFCGNFFPRGKAGNEYVEFNIVNQHDNNIIWTIDTQKRKLLAYACCRLNNDSIFQLTTEFNYKIADDLFSVFILQNELYAYKAYSQSKGLFYKNAKSGMEFTPYNRKFKKNDLNNIMTLADCMKPDGSKIASLTGIWDEVDIISIDGSDENRSITTSKHLMSWRDYVNMGGDGFIDYYISLPRCNDKYIAVLHDNQKNHEILFFDWNGKGKARYALREKLLDFAIDWERCTIYGLTENEKIYKYVYNI